MPAARHFALIGCGTIADFHADAIRAIPGAELVVVAERNETRAREFAEKQKTEWVTDHRALLARPDVDIVCVTTPSGSHAALGLDVLRAGKHLVVEKPVAMNAQDAADLVALAREKRLV